jgi:hypothetical protein
MDAALERVRDALKGVRLPLDLPSAAPAAEYAARQVVQLDDYILPRLAEQNAPLVAVVGGSTGAGKSTLVNSLIGRAVSPSSALRPTTRVPLLVHNPADASWFDSQRILPNLARTRDESPAPGTLRLVAEVSQPEGLAILDAPDVDSVVEENRSLAGELLAAADLWIFLTTAARYADAVPWDHLKQAAERNVLVALVLDRVPPRSMDEVRGYLTELMARQGLGGSRLFCIPEVFELADGLLPAEAIAELREWLAGLAGDAAERNRVMMQTLTGAVDSLARHLPEVVTALRDQHQKVTDLRMSADRAYREALSRINQQTADGTMLRGEVLDKWQDFVGTGEFFRAVEQRIGSIRDRIAAFFRGAPKQADEVSLAIESGLDILVREEAEAAAQRVYELWSADPAGKQLITAAKWNIGRGSPGLAASATELVRAWREDVLKLVSEQGYSKRSKARYLALGVNGVGVALMILVFSQTGGLLGAEVGIAGGTAVLAQRVLEAVFGEDAVRKLAKEAKLGLDKRIQELLAAESARYGQLLGTLGVTLSAARWLETALDEVRLARAEDDRLGG